MNTRNRIRFLLLFEFPTFKSDPVSLDSGLDHNPVPGGCMDRPSSKSSKDPAPSRDQTPELPERWSAQRKTELVLRLLRGESLDTVSRESHVPAHELESWQ